MGRILSNRQRFAIINNPICPTIQAILNFPNARRGRITSIRADQRNNHRLIKRVSFTHSLATSVGVRVPTSEPISGGEGDAPAAGDAAPLVKLRLTTDKENAGSFAVGRLSTSQPQG